MAVTLTEAQLILPGSGDDAAVTWSHQLRRRHSRGIYKASEIGPEEKTQARRNTKQAPAVGMSPTNCLEPAI